jgi:hypothetical protein
MSSNTEDFKDIPDLEMLSIISGLADVISDESKRRHWRGLSSPFGEIQNVARQMMSDRRKASLGSSVNMSMEPV